MQIVVPKEGPRAPLFFSVATLLLLLAEVAATQSVDLSVLERCASLDTPEEKLACFEAIVASNGSSATDIPDAAPSIVVETASMDGSEVARTAAPEPNAVSAPEPGPVSAEAIRTVAEATPIVVESATRDFDPAPQEAEKPDPLVASTPAPTSSEPPATELGAEQLPEQNRDADQTVTATVVEVRQGYDRTLSFHMANGQVWRQIEARRLQYPRNEEFEVIISQGMLGEYRLRIGENGRLVKIRRIQ